MSTAPQPPHAPWLDPSLLLASCGWLGRIPIAPGTFGSLLGLPLSLVTGATAAWLAGRLGGDGGLSSPLIESGLIALMVTACIPACTRAARLLDAEDPGAVVIDEALAVPTVLVLVPVAARDATVLMTAFVLFRVFDILKPPPVRQAERLPDGLGILADDQVAAALAAACLAAARWQRWL